MLVCLENVLPTPKAITIICTDNQFLYFQKLDGGISFDFKNPEALRYLTTILLKKDFNLDVHIPEEKLVPTLPLRLNYILWLEDVLEWKPETNSSVKGIDIGMCFSSLNYSFYIFLKICYNY